MSRWTGVVLAGSGPGDEMESRVAAYLHPIAGRPLVWHAVWSLTQVNPAPGRVVVISDDPLPPELFADLSVPVEVLADGGALHRLEKVPHGEDSVGALVVDAAAAIPRAALQALVDAEPGRWVAGDPARACATLLDWARLPQLFRLPDPFHVPSGVLSSQDRLPARHEGLLVRDRHQLALAMGRIRDRLVRHLMQSGVTFLLPETVLVDVDVRIGRDTIVYPGAVLEGQTTIGEETVIGPGCRIVDSWVGSGVELKGWNYISHTSIRNRAILEPHVRRGFD